MTQYIILEYANLREINVCEIIYRELIIKFSIISNLVCQKYVLLKPSSGLHVHGCINLHPTFII